MLSPHGDILFSYDYRVVAQGVLEIGGSERAAVIGGPWVIAALAAAVAVVLGIAVATSPRRLVVAAGGVASVTVFVVTCLFALGIRYPPPGLVAGSPNIGSRYTIVPTLLLMSALAVTAQAVVDRWAGRLGVAVRAAALVPLLLFLAFDYQADRDVRGGTESWSAQVARATDACRTAPPEAEQVLIAAPTEAWQVTIDCAALTGDR